MRYLVDTNVLLRGIQQTHIMHLDAKRSAALLTRQGEQLSIIAQNMVEFWAVATRPAANNGLALSVHETAQHVAIFKKVFTLLPDTPHILPEWEQLVVKHQVLGKQVHDARLVAAMLVHRVTHVLTFNVADFKRYSEITVVSPSSVH